MATQKFTGVIPPVVVPDTEDHQLDVASFERSINRMIDAGVDGLFFLGSSGEVVFSTDERRRQIIKRQSRARKAHFRRVGSQLCAPENKAVYNQLLLCLERAGNECSNLVEHGAELSMWGDALGADRRPDAPAGELAEALA